MTKDKKKAGDGIPVSTGNWSFSGEVISVFDEHIAKSVPWYNEGHELTCKISDFFLSRNSLCYEFGCSTGNLIRKLAEYNKHKENVQFVGIDVESDMIKEANSRKPIKNLSFVCKDVLSYDLKNSDMIISYYTSQFIKARDRQLYFDKIYNSLNWGGALILFEKVRGPDARFQDIYTYLYNSYKEKNGYTIDEIYNKSKTLAGVLDPFSEEGNLDLIRRSGFKDISSIMKYICFTGFIAIK